MYIYGKNTTTKAIRIDNSSRLANMFSSLLRRRRRAFSWILLGLTTFVFLCFWNFNSMNSESAYSTVQRFRLFGGASDDELPTNFYKLPADDPELLNIVRRLIRPPSALPYNFTRQNSDDFSRGQSPVINELLHGKEKGYFVECGAYDGEENSVTVYFEKLKSWGGLLIEPDRGRYNRMLEKHRHAHTINACVRTDFENLGRPEKSTESQAYFKGGSRDGQKPAPCFWISTLLLATSQKQTDLLSLDLSGNEVALLKTIDFSKVKINTVTLEMDVHSPENDVMSVVDFVKPYGYSAVHQFTDHVRNTKDLVLKLKEV